MYVIKLENTVTHQIFQYEVDDNNEGQKLYYEFNINTLDLEDGEYLLTLYAEDGNVLSEDILKIGDYKPNTLQYTKGDNTYIAVELDAKLGHKNAVIEDYNSNVYPDDGYDGMTDVSIDAYPVYERGRNEGYADGYNVGNGDGYIKGNQEGYNQGYNKGYDDGDRNGYSNGYMSGYEVAEREIVETAQVLEITENGSYQTKYNGGEGNLIKTINVNVQPKINIAESGLKFGQSTFESIPDIFDFEGITNFEYLFYYCTYLKTIPQLDTSKVTTMYYTFYDCPNLQSIPQLDTSKVENMYYTFNGCAKLKTIPQLDTSKVKTMNNIFYGCTNLQSIPKIDCSSIDNSYNSTSFFGSSTLNNLTDIGGFEGLKISSNNNYGLVKVPNLTYESCINILNGLYDFVGNGETPNSSQGKLKVHQNFLNLVGDEIAIGTNKGWTITA